MLQDPWKETIDFQRSCKSQARLGPLQHENQERGNGLVSVLSDPSILLSWAGGPRSSLIDCQLFSVTQAEEDGYDEKHTTEAKTEPAPNHVPQLKRLSYRSVWTNRLSSRLKVSSCRYPLSAPLFEAGENKGMSRRHNPVLYRWIRPY